MDNNQQQLVISFTDNESLADLFPNEIWGSDSELGDLPAIFCDSDFTTEPDQTCDFSGSPVAISNTVEIPDHSSPTISVPAARKYWLVDDAVSKRARAPKLYEFLVLLVKNPKYEDVASFTDREKGIFQIHQPEKVAELWQSVKNRQSNSKMTYDKFARAIRWYYKANLMKKTNTRYTFQFSPQLLKAYFTDEDNSDPLTGGIQLVLEDCTSLFEDCTSLFENCSNLFEDEWSSFVTVFINHSDQHAWRNANSNATKLHVGMYMTI